jgi:hypothetical protein
MVMVGGVEAVAEGEGDGDVGGVREEEDEEEVGGCERSGSVSVRGESAVLRLRNAIVSCDGKKLRVWSLRNLANC